jgi:hypothetical protein
MPVLPLEAGQRFEELLGDDVLDAVEVCVLAIPVEEDALCEVLVYLAAEVVRLHLVRRVLFHRMEAGDIHIHRLQRLRSLQELGSRFERFGFGRVSAAFRAGVGAFRRTAGANGLKRENRGEDKYKTPAGRLLGLKDAVGRDPRGVD